MLSALKNASMAGNDYIETFYSKECEAVSKVLKEAGFLDEVKVFKHKEKKYKGLRLELTKVNGEFALIDLKRVSKPGRRVYTGSDDINRVSGGHGVLVVSTSRGLMSGEEARKKKLGGEVICKVL